MTEQIAKNNRGRRDERGSALLEFAIGSIILVSAFAGTFQFGYTFLQYNDLENAVNQGAHYAAVRSYDSATTTPSSAFNTAVQNMVVYGTPSPGASPTPIVKNLATGNVTLTVTFTNGVPSAMTVAITGFTINSLFGSQTLTGKPKITYTYQGIYEPI